MALAALSVAGCIGFIEQADDLTTWSRVPLAADPGLAAHALESCRMQDENFVPQLVLQDQRTAKTAAFLLAGPGWSGSCMLSGSGGGSGSGWTSEPLPAFAGPVAVDEQGVGGLGNGTATLHGGRTAAGVVGVEVQLANGVTVVASVGNGHWLAWWTGGVLADTITATFGDGTTSVLAWGPDGWAER